MCPEAKARYSPCKNTCSLNIFLGSDRSDSVFCENCYHSMSFTLFFPLKAEITKPSCLTEHVLLFFFFFSLFCFDLDSKAECFLMCMKKPVLRLKKKQSSDIEIIKNTIWNICLSCRTLDTEINTTNC